MSAVTPACNAEPSGAQLPHIIRFQPSRLALICHLLATGLAGLAGLLSPLPWMATMVWLGLTLVFGVLGVGALRRPPSAPWLLLADRCYRLGPLGERYPLQVWRGWRWGVWLQRMLYLGPDGRRHGVLIWPDTTDAESRRRLRTAHFARD